MGMNKIHAFATIALALSLAAGCSRERSAPATLASHGAEAPAASAVSGGAGGSSDNAKSGDLKVGANTPVGRSLIVTMDVGITVQDVDKARAAIRDEVEHAGGYVADANASGSGAGRS